MDDWQINGAPPIVAGSIMIPPNTDAGIVVPGGIIKLYFKTKGEQGYTWENFALTITAKPNPLGVGINISLRSENGKPLMFALTIHTIGEGSTAYRIVHYTAYPG